MTIPSKRRKVRKPDPKLASILSSEGWTTLPELDLRKDRRKKRKSRMALLSKLPQEFSSDAFLESLAEALPDDGFKSTYLKDEYLSKYLDEKKVSASERRSAAIRKFRAVEELNAKTNQRLYLNDTDLGWVTSSAFFEEVRRLTARILGDPDVDLARARYTNGASTGVRRSSTAAYQKLSGVQHISSSAVRHWVNTFSGTLMGSFRGGPGELELVESSVLFTVPKKTEIDRVACKEPTCNALLQRACGEYIRNRLRRVGIDLRDQTVNQSLARVGVSQRLATIDLSSASDTVTKQLVQNCLPFGWWSLLFDLRVASTLIDGELHELEMFSSMGNGFTFELETLLFYAITRVVARHCRVKGRISVYGDDIIAPCAIVPRLLRVLNFCGFKPNVGKTHYTGDFRESCGHHYWRGQNVTPFYVRRPVTTLPDLINILNSVLEWDGRGFGFFTTESLLRWWEKWKRFVPDRLYGGIDPKDPSALVTGDLPRFRIRTVMGLVRIDQNIGYLYWHHVRYSVNTSVGGEPTVDRKRIFLMRLKSAGERTSWAPALAFG